MQHHAIAEDSRNHWQSFSIIASTCFSYIKCNQQSRLLLFRVSNLFDVFEDVFDIALEHLYDSAEWNGHVPEHDDDIAANMWVLQRLKNLEQKPMMLIAELRTNTQEFAESQCGGPSQRSILSVTQYRIVMWEEHLPWICEGFHIIRP